MSAISTRTALVVQAVIGEIGNALEPKVNLTHRIRGQGSAIGIVDPDRATGQWPPDSAGLRERFLGAVDDEGARLSRSIIFLDDRPRGPVITARTTRSGAMPKTLFIGKVRG